MRQKAELALLLGLVVVLVGTYLSRRSSSAPTPVAVATPGTVRSAASGPLAIPDAVLRTGRLEARDRVPVGDVGRNIFQYGRRQRVEAPVTQATATPEVAPPPAPPPAPAPVRFYGFAESSRSGRRRVFLTDGEEIYVVVEGDIILRRYRLLRVGKESIEVEELAGNRRWVVPLEQP